MTGVGWKTALEDARRPPTQAQQAWDAQFDRQHRIVRRTIPDPTVAAVAAYARTEDQYGKRPSNEETT